MEYFKDNKTSAEYDNELQIIRTILEHSYFENIKYKDNPLATSKYIPINNIKENEIEKMVLNFDYAGLHNLMERNGRQLSYETPNLYMQQAYICSLLGDYGLAYNYLKIAASIFYKSNSYVWYFIAVFNQKYVGRFLENPFINNLDTNERNKIINEAENIDLEKILNSLPRQNNDDYLFLKDLSNFNIAYTLFYDTFKNSVKANKEAKTSYAMYFGTTACQKLRISIRDYNSYIVRNYIILDRYTESSSIFILYIRSIISSVSTRTIQPDPDEYFSTGNVKLEEIGIYEIYAILKYMNQNEIKQLFDEYEIKFIPVDKEGLDYINNIFDSLCKYSKYTKSNMQSEDIIWSYLELVSHIKINVELTIAISNNLCGRNLWELDRNSNVIERFFINTYNQKHYLNNELCENITKIIDTILDNSSTYNCNSLLRFLTLFNYKGNNLYNDTEKIRNITINNNLKLTTNLFQNLGKDAQQIILDFFLEWKPEKSIDGYIIYCRAVLNDIMEKNADIEKEVFNWILSDISSKENSNAKFIKVFPLYDYNNVLEELMTLYLNNKLIDVDTLKTIINDLSNDKWKWLLDVDKFDYSNFDCNWLENCHSTLLKFISQHNIAAKSILKAYKNQYKTKALSTRITDYIVKYFLIDDATEAKEPITNS